MLQRRGMVHLAGRFAAVIAAGSVLSLCCLNLPAQDPQEVARQLNLSLPELQNLQQLSGYSLDYFSRMPVAGLARVERRIRYPDIQRLRAQYDALQYGIGAGGPADDAQALGAKLRAAQQFRALQLETRRSVSAGVPVGVPEKARGAGITKESWQWLGPANVGGRTRAIVIHPDKPDTIWVGATGGGVWRTDNGGQQWQALDNLLSNISIACMVVQPGNPDCLVVGTGEGLGRLDDQADLRGDGIFISSDGGADWTQLPATKSADFAFVHRLAFSADGKVLLAGTWRGIYRSTDLGKSWQKTSDVETADVDFHPKDPSQAIAGSYQEGKILVSADGGSSWKAADYSLKAEFLEGRVEQCYSTADPSVVYALVNVENGVLLRSSDAGKSFTRVGGAKDVFGPNHQGQGDSTIWAGDPKSADIVVVGGLDLHKSTDGGKTFKAISYWPMRQSTHADQHAIVSHPKYDGVSNKIVYFGNDGGIYKMTDLAIAGDKPDGTSGWVNLNNGYGVTQFYDAAGNAQSGIILAGAQDNGTLRYRPQDGPNKWFVTMGGDGGFCAVDPTNPRILYGQYVFLEIFRSDDAGFDGSTINGLETASFAPSDAPGQTRRWKLPPQLLRDAREKGRRCNFISPYLIDPNDSNRMLAGGWSLWRTNNVKEKVTTAGGPEWYEIKLPIGKDPVRPKEMTNEAWMKVVEATYRGFPISAIEVGKGDPDTIWVGHNNGQVYKSAKGTDKKPEWTHVGEGVLPGRWVHSIHISPHDKNRVYVGFVGYSHDNLWMTEDGGKTWKNLGAKLPEGGVRTVLVHPKNPNWVYIGTDSGILTSENGGATFDPVNAGPALVRVSKLFWMGEKLVAATYGRGVYSAEINNP